MLLKVFPNNRLSSDLSIDISIISEECTRRLKCTCLLKTVKNIITMRRIRKLYFKIEFLHFNVDIFEGSFDFEGISQHGVNLEVKDSVLFEVVSKTAEVFIFEMEVCVWDSVDFNVVPDGVVNEHADSIGILSGVFFHQGKTACEISLLLFFFGFFSLQMLFSQILKLDGTHRLSSIFIL